MVIRNAKNGGITENSARRKVCSSYPIAFVKSTNWRIKPKSIGKSMSTNNKKLDVEKKKNGAVNTPNLLADYVASKVLSYYYNNGNKQEIRLMKNMPLKILDPACGNGELLSAMWNNMSKTLYDNNDVTPATCLYGMDIDEKAVISTKNRLGFSLTSNNIIKTNGLFPYNKSREDGWKLILKKWGITDGVDISIANPPWGADVADYRKELEKGEYSLFNGQFDTSDLFIECSLSITKPGGFIAFIIPDSLFYYERKKLRKMLLDKCDIFYIGRMGEQIFPNINRACVVIIGRIATNKKKNTQLVECMRLTPTIRKKILTGNMSFYEAEKLLKHTVYQNQFYKNKDYLFSIDISSVEEETMSKIYDYDKSFGTYLKSGRGVELSKKGIVMKCNKCGLWMPLSKKDVKVCGHCNYPMRDYDQRSITSVKKRDGYIPFIVGENIRRYWINETWWVNSSLPGINYKSSKQYIAPKLLIRKTGVGICASIDYSNAYTNQVVYICHAKKEYKNKMPLELFLGILNSRAILYYLIKQHGETEWKSHPYITQKQIMGFPIPDLGKVDGTIIQEIVKIVKKILQNGTSPNSRDDARIEYLISRIYNLTKNDYKEIFNTINSIQDLKPFKALRNIKINDVFEDR